MCKCSCSYMSQCTYRCQYNLGRVISLPLCESYVIALRLSGLAVCIFLLFCLLWERVSHIPGWFQACCKSLRLCFLSSGTVGVCHMLKSSDWLQCFEVLSQIPGGVDLNIAVSSSFSVFGCAYLNPNTAGWPGLSHFLTLLSFIICLAEPSGLVSHPFFKVLMFLFFKSVYVDYTTFLFMSITHFNHTLFCPTLSPIL